MHASLELCKELYELSGWNDETEFHYDLTDGLIGVGLPRKAVPGNVEIPAYDLGYLIRKLPKSIDGDSLGVSWAQITGNCWRADYGFGLKIKTQYDKTPENVLCKLAIELIKQGILPTTRGQGDKQ